MNRLIKVCTLVIIALVSAFASGTPAAAQDAETLHWAAWDSALAVAETDPAQRYAYYAYHTLAVPHPEVYLQTDAVFSSIVEKMPGSRIAFKGADVRNIDLFRSLLTGKHEGPAFNWRMWVPTADSIYDSSEPGAGMSWLDHRVASAAILLTAPSPRMNTAEAAMMRYTQRRRGGEPDSALFVVIDVNGHGYLASNGSLISVNSGRPWDGDPASVVPALVFNERYVVYPLFGRDDRAKCNPLSRLLGTLSTAVRPQLSDADSARVARLATAAALPSRVSFDLARIAALGALGLTNKVVGAMWSELLGQADTTVMGCEEGMLRLIVYRANLLSPYTASLAVAGPDTPFDSATAAWERLYLSWCGRRINPRDTVQQIYEAGGYIWAYELLELTFDDIIRTRAGSGSSQALAMAAALDLGRVPNMRVAIDPGDNAKPEQHWILCEGGSWQFNYGHWQRIEDAEVTSVRFPLIINSYSVTDQWSNLIIPYLYTNSDPFTISEELTRLTVMMPRASLRLRTGPEKTVPVVEFMLQMDNDQVEWRPYPWPPVEDGAMRGEIEGQ